MTQPDTEARERTPAEILATGAGWITESELARLVARLEAAERALSEIRDKAAWYARNGKRSSHEVDHALCVEVLSRAEDGLAALAAAAPGETEQTP